MTDQLGMAGSRARSLALERIQAQHRLHNPAPAPFPNTDGSLPLVQRTVSNTPPEEDERSTSAAVSGETGEAATERETHPPSPEEVADLVYRLFCQDLRRERERRGRW